MRHLERVPLLNLSTGAARSHFYFFLPGILFFKIQNSLWFGHYFLIILLNRGFTCIHIYRRHIIFYRFWFFFWFIHHPFFSLFYSSRLGIIKSPCAIFIGIRFHFNCFPADNLCWILKVIYIYGIIR